MADLSAQSLLDVLTLAERHLQARGRADAARAQDLEAARVLALARLTASPRPDVPGVDVTWGTPLQIESVPGIEALRAQLRAHLEAIQRDPGQFRIVPSVEVES